MAETTAADALANKGLLSLASPTVTPHRAAVFALRFRKSGRPEKCPPLRLRPCSGWFRFSESRWIRPNYAPLSKKWPNNSAHFSLDVEASRVSSAQSDQLLIPPRILPRDFVDCCISLVVGLLLTAVLFGVPAVVAFWITRSETVAFTPSVLLMGLLLFLISVSPSKRIRISL